MTRLYLVRHARATAPGDLRLPGPDLPLTEHGSRQAEALARRLRPLGPAAVYTSDALRAQQTAAAIVGGASGGELLLAIDPSLREVDFGGWSGRTYDDIVAEQPTAAEYFSDPTSGAPPGGEPVADVASRVVGAFERISRSHPRGSCVIVGHAGSLRLALAAALGLPLGSYWRFRLDCAGLTVLDWGDSGVVVERLNDVCHLPNDEDIP